MGTDGTASLDQYLKPIIEHKIIIGVVTLAVTVLGVVAALALPASYEATAVVLVSPVSSDPSESVANNTEVDMETELRLVSSNAVIERASQKLTGQAISLPATELKNNSTASNPGDSRIIDIDHRAGTPERAQAGANALAESYIDYRAELAEETARTASDALNQQIAELKDELAVVASSLAAADEGSDAYIAATIEQSVISRDLDAQLAALANLNTISSNVGRVVDPAQQPTAPSGLGLIPIVLGALVGGLVLGCMAAFVLSAIRAARRSDVDAESDTETSMTVRRIEKATSRRAKPTPASDQHLPDLTEVPETRDHAISPPAAFSIDADQEPANDVSETAAQDKPARKLRRPTVPVPDALRPKRSKQDGSDATVATPEVAFDAPGRVEQPALELPEPSPVGVDTPRAAELSDMDSLQPMLLPDVPDSPVDIAMDPPEPTMADAIPSFDEPALAYPVVEAAASSFSDTGLGVPEHPADTVAPQLPEPQISAPDAPPSAFEPTPAHAEPAHELVDGLDTLDGHPSPAEQSTAIYSMNEPTPEPQSAHPLLLPNQPLPEPFDPELYSPPPPPSASTDAPVPDVTGPEDPDLPPQPQLVEPPVVDEPEVPSQLQPQPNPTEVPTQLQPQPSPAAVPSQLQPQPSSAAVPTQLQPQVAEPGPAYHRPTRPSADEGVSPSQFGPHVEPGDQQLFEQPNPMSTNAYVDPAQLGQPLFDGPESSEPEPVSAEPPTPQTAAMLQAAATPPPVTTPQALVSQASGTVMSIDEALGAPAPETATGTYDAVPAAVQTDQTRVRRSDLADLVAHPDYSSVMSALRRLGQDGPAACVSIGEAGHEGSLAVGLGLAETLQDSGAKVLVVDMMLDTPTLHQLIGQPIGPGLTDVLSGAARLAQAAVEPPGLGGLKVLAAGTMEPDQVTNRALLNHANIANLISQAAGLAHVIVFLGGSVEEAARHDDALAQMGGLVVGTDEPAGAPLDDRLAERLDQLSTSVLGLVSINDALTTNRTSAGSPAHSH